VDHAVEFPLDVDLVEAAERGTVHAFPRADIGKHRFNGAEPATVNGPTFRRIDFFLHAGSERLGDPAVEDADLAGIPVFRMTQAAVA